MSRNSTPTTRWLGVGFGWMRRISGRTIEAIRTTSFNAFENPEAGARFLSNFA
jgi:hypothetical protein